MKTEPETIYKELAGEDGYNNAVRSFTMLCVDDTAGVNKALFFTTMLNAYWRGANKAVTDCREVVARAKGIYNVPTNKRAN